MILTTFSNDTSLPKKRKNVSETEPPGLSIGRQHLPNKDVRVSREHCKVWISNEPAVLNLHCLSRLWVEKLGSKELALYKSGADTKLVPGEKFYLLNEDGGLNQGFLVQAKPAQDADATKKDIKTPKKRKPASTIVPHAPVKRKKPIVSSQGTLIMDPPSTVQASTPKVGYSGPVRMLNGIRGRKPLPPVPADMPKFLEGLHFCFWQTRHLAHMMQLLEATGAIIEDSVSPRTTYIVAPKDMPAQKIAEKLNLDPDKDTFPEDKYLVEPNFVAGCIGHRKLLDPRGYLVYCGMRTLHDRPSVNGQGRSAIHEVKEPQAEQQEARTCESPNLGDVGNLQKPVSLVTVTPPYELQKFTGGDSGIPWGTGGIWLEPWDMKSARETVDKLRRNWHKEKPDAGVSRASSSETDDISETLVVSEGQCGHKSCSAAVTCFVAELQKLLEGYPKSDHFRRRAAEDAIRKLKTYHKPVTGQRDCLDMKLGKKSAEKVCEILETGRLARNQRIANDPKLQTLRQFEKVWGAASTTAQKWYDEGCRTLEDVRNRTDLTTQQLAGLKYFDDMQEKIPREEGGKIAGHVRSLILDVFHWSIDGEDAAHVRQMGSFLRGKPKLSDVDLLVVPPESEDRSPSQLLQIVLNKLSEENSITDDMRLEVHDKGEHHSASWLGFCKLQNQPRVRRMDIKIYHRQYLPFAIMYFTGSGVFNRALRHWANTAVLERAQQYAPDATGFKLNDTLLIPRAKHGWGKDRHEVMLGQPISEIRCETDIFKILGLDYVPPHLRMSGDM